MSLVVGETASGKASRSLAQHIPGTGNMEGMKGAASGVVGDLARARIALDERGQKLGELEERTAAMMSSADSFSKHAHDVRILHLFKQVVFTLTSFVFDSHLFLFLPSDDAEVQRQEVVPALMAACGASDSKYTHTSISEELQVPLLLCFSPWGFCSTDSCFYSQHNITYSALPQSPEDCRRVDTGQPDVTKMERNGRREAPRNLSFHFTRER